MTKRIFHSLFLAVTAVLLASFCLLTGVLYSYFGTVQKEQLKSELMLAAQAVETGGTEYLKGLKTSDFRLTLVGADGTVLFDTQSDEAQMENHGEREEIAQAFASGFGESERFSSTLTEKTVYYARLLSDNTVLRISVSRATAFSLVLEMLWPLVLILLLALIFSAFLAERLAKKIVEPLNGINLEKPLENDAYDELSPLLTHIEQQQRMISAQKTELKNKKNEFYAVIKNMKEGLVLIGGDGSVLSINPAACEFFGAEDAQGKSFLELERSFNVGKMLEKAQSDGRAEMQTDRDGRAYQLIASRIGKAGAEAGTALLVLDVTERVFAERNRREFTANISHELKTPLHSIMGSAELLENGLVAQEDIPRFMSRIRSEASRLVKLIEDIIRLSQLDGNDNMTEEDIDLFELAKDEIASLSHFAEVSNVAFKLQGERTVVKGVPRLMHEIVYNLCENAVKYNKDGGSVTVTVQDNAITVADTGIGIPPEHRQRVFERFYRVDKSRSKETGGTGLGLSIVKHAAQYMNARIELQSAVGEGTEITVKFNS